jgi:hypothetical protein
MSCMCHACVLEHVGHLPAIGEQIVLPTSPWRVNAASSSTSFIGFTEDTGPATASLEMSMSFMAPSKSKPDKVFGPCTSTRNV